MTYSDFELSPFRAAPIHMFRFDRVNDAGVPVLSVCYTSDSRSHEYGGKTFTPLAIARGALRDSAEGAKNNLPITMPVTASIAPWWRPYPPSQRVFVRCYSKHRHDPDQEVKTEWVGRVIGRAYTKSLLELTCEPSRSTSKRTAAQNKHCRGCPLALYSQGLGMCNVNKEDHKIETEISDIYAGLQLISDDFLSVPTGRMAGGFIEWDTPDGLVESRSIMEHSTNVITIDYSGAEVATGLALRAFPGCDQSREVCKDYYDNLDNFGGCPDLPEQNPFEGNPIW